MHKTDPLSCKKAKKKLVIYSRLRLKQLTNLSVYIHNVIEITFGVEINLFSDILENELFL